MSIVKRLLMLKWIVAVLAIVVFAFYCYYTLAFVTNEDFVDCKCIVGISNSLVHSILLETPFGVIVKDSDFKLLFSNQSEIAVNESLEDVLKRKYSKILYYVSIESLNGTLSYLTSRDCFNKARVGDLVRFKVFRFVEIPTVVELWCYK